MNNYVKRLALTWIAVILAGCSLIYVTGNNNAVIDQTKEGLIIENDK